MKCVHVQRGRIAEGTAKSREMPFLSLLLIVPLMDDHMEEHGLRPVNDF